ncbi:hypothetical protein BGX27_004341 [Mortierella sp. AM989]|nr:hypothetical protein BGX27_004341 [Mortierella sp. AM989]
MIVKRRTSEEPEAPTAQRRKRDGDSNMGEEDEIEESEDDSSDESDYRLSDYDEDYEDDGLSNVDDSSTSLGEVSEDD